jgi:hypothetical protein
MFDRTAFYAAFEGQLNSLASAEKITKDTLRDLSRDVLYVLFETEDISFVNRVTAALTPINRKVALLFFKAHTGFKFERETGKFISKDKKVYDKVAENTLNLLNEDPHFNLWTWADKNIEVEVKPLDLSKITVFVKNALKKADEQGIKKSEVFKAMMQGGFTADELIDIMAEMAE